MARSDPVAIRPICLVPLIMFSKGLRTLAPRDASIPRRRMGEALVKNSSRRTIPVTCTTHGGGKNFCNLLMTKESDGTIVLDPHVANCCVLRLDYAAATAVFDTLGTWLG